MLLKKLIIIICFLAIFLPVNPCFAADDDTAASDSDSLPSVPDILDVIGKATEREISPDAPDGQDWSGPIKLVIVFTALAVIPSMLVMMTSFTRIIIVLSFARRALGTQTIPPTIAIIGLALFLTLFTMSGTFKQINQKAIQPYLAEEADFNTAIAVSGETIKDFMIRQTRDSDLQLFVQMSKIEQPEKPEDVPLYVSIPAFIISEFRISFEIGCLLFIPFLIIDLVIASVLLSAGMMMLPPVMISLPFKLILFILVDGWSLLAKSLSLSFQ